MINKLSILLAFFGVLLFTELNLEAQQKNNNASLHNTPERRAEGQTQFLARQFKLNEEITKKIYLINLRFEIIADSIRLSNNSNEKKSEAFKIGAIKKREAYKMVMTPEQYLNYTRFIDEMRIKAKKFKESKK